MLVTDAQLEEAQLNYTSTRQKVFDSHLDLEHNIFIKTFKLFMAHYSPLQNLFFFRFVASVRRF